MTVGRKRGEIHRRCREDVYRISLVSGWNARDKPRVPPCSQAGREKTPPREEHQEEQAGEVNEYTSEVLLQHSDGCYNC